MKNAELRRKFTWHDVVADGKWVGWGWAQSCTVNDHSVDIDCVQVPEPEPDILPTIGMRLHIESADRVTWIKYVDSGFALHEYVVKLPFESVLIRLMNVVSAPVHQAAAELLSGLSKDGLLTLQVGSQRRRRGQLTH